MQAGGKKMKLLENKKFIVTVIILNCIVISILIGYLITTRVQEPPEKQSKMAEQEIVVDESDDELENIYMSLLEGSHFSLEDDIEFNFDENGMYSGFFDSKNKKVKEYQYSIAVKEEIVYLQILNPDKSKMVEYEMSFDENGNLVLKHQDIENAIILSY